MITFLPTKNIYMNILFKFLTATVCTLALSGCAERLSTYVGKEYEASHKEISLRNFAEKNGFHWDYVYYIPMVTESDEISKVLDIDKLPSKHPKIEGVHLIFMNDGKIVFWERWSGIDWEEYNDIGIFNSFYHALGMSDVSPVLFSPSDEILKLTPENAVFEIDKKNGGFELKLIGESPIINP